MSHLDDGQRQALAQLQDLTNGGDNDVAISVLDSVNWDVQRAAELIFGAASVPSSTPMQAFEMDDSNQGQARARPTRPLYLSFRPFISVLTFPLHIISNIFRFIFGILRIPLPQLRFSTLNFYRPLPRGPRPLSRGGPDRWVRELEEETGAVCIGRSKMPSGISSATPSGAGPSSLTARPHASDEARRVLPDFTFGTYDEVLRICQKEARVGCVILVSEEHDDVTEFKRSTLTDPVFVKTLYDNNIVVWGGDVRDQEAWSAAEKLQATTYPFVAFLSLQPRRHTGLSSSRSTTTSSPVLTVLSRHQGPPTPNSGPTSAQSLVDHLTTQLLPRVTPFIERIQASHRERERDRRLREDQDRAFNETARRDKERIEAKMEEERQERARARARQEEDEMRLLEQKERQRKEDTRLQWRRWIRRTAMETGILVEQAGGMRIAVRLPSGARVVHVFGQNATLTTLYAFVDTNLIPPEYSTDDDPMNPPENGFWNGDLERCIEDRISAEVVDGYWWKFQLVLAYPRSEIPWKAQVGLKSIEGLRGGGQVVVEMGGGIIGHQDGGSSEHQYEDDGYDTENSE